MIERRGCELRDVVERQLARRFLEEAVAQTEDVLLALAERRKPCGMTLLIARQLKPSWIPGRCSCWVWLIIPTIRMILASRAG